MRISKNYNFTFLPISVKIIIYLSVGLASMIFIHFLVGLFTINKYTTIAIALTSFVVLVITLIKGTQKIDLKKMHLSIDAVLLVIYSIGFLYIIVISNYLRWPVAGDAITHGAIISLIQFKQKIPPTFSPLGEMQMYYPPGFHAMAAAFAFVSGVLPGESALLLAAYTTALIPALISSIIYLKTKSIAFSALAYFGPFVITTGQNWKWVFGYFFNGTYPCLLGLVLMLTIFFLTGFLGNPNAMKSIATLIMLVTLALIVVYPSYAFFVAPYFIYMLYKNSQQIVNFLKKNWRGVILAAIVGLALVSQIWSVSRAYFFFITRVFSGQTPHIMGYYINLSYLYDNLNGFIILISILLSFIHVAKREMDVLCRDSFFLVICVPTLLSSVPCFYRYFSYLLPRRAAVLLMLAAWVVFIANLYHFVPMKSGLRLGVNIKRLRVRASAHSLYVGLIAILILSICAPSLQQHFTFQLASQKAWFTRNSDGSLNYRMTDDFEAINWMRNNISPKDLILNDLSWSSLYIPSFSLMNVTFSYFSENSRALELKEIWKNPKDIALMTHLLDKYNIGYVFVTSEWGYYDWEGWGGDGAYKTKPHDYIKLFDQYQFLLPAYTSGRTKLYMVREETNVTRMEISWSTLGVGQGLLSPPEITHDCKVEGTDATKVDINDNGTFSTAILCEDFDPYLDLNGSTFIKLSLFGNNTNCELN